MPNKTLIEWTDYTSNGLAAHRRGHDKGGWFCDKPDKDGGCFRCYAESLNLRWGNGLKFDKALRDLVEFTVRQKEQSVLLKLNQKHPGQKVFVADMFDLFQPSIPDDLLKMLFNTYDDCTDLILQFLTKYPARMANFFEERYRYGSPIPRHFWVGMSAATRKWFNRNIHQLLRVNGLRFISFEPLLEDFKLEPTDLLGIRWAIIGGESGTGARPCNLEWIRSLIARCRGANTAPFVKQLGTKPIYRVDSEMGRALSAIEWPTTNGKGGDMNEWPEDLRVREFPA